MTRASDTAKLLGAGATINDGTTITTADNTTQLTLTSTDTDANVGPVLNLSRDNSSAADNDLVGEVQFNADDDGNNQTTYGKILTVIEDASNGSEDGLMQIHTNVGGTLRDRIKITSSELVLNEESIDSDFRVESNGDANMLFVDGGNNRIGIGTNSPSYQIDAGSGTTVNQRLRLQRGSDDTNQFATFGWQGIQVHRANVALSSTQTNMKFEQVGSDGTRTSAMLDGSGNFLVGQTVANTNAVGHGFFPSGFAYHVVDGGQVLAINRQSDDGTLISLRQANNVVGNISSGPFRIFATGVNNTGWSFGDNSAIEPMKNSATADNLVDLGTSSKRMDDIFATNGTIQTSDRNEKQDIEELTDAEKRVAVVAKGLMRKFRWKDKVAIKGDSARTHFGIIAQDLQDAFTAESLDASKYAMFCSDTWWEKEITVDAIEAVKEVKDEEGNVTTEAVEAKDAYTYMDNKYEATDGYTEKTRLGVRYSELLAFIISAI